MEIENFTHNGKEYEIRIVSDGEVVYVKAFYDSRPANRFRYMVMIENLYDLKKIIGLDAVKHLIEMAKNDIVLGLK